MKIVDCFTFYNELDLLNYRLNILNPVVDYFILVEATHTHSGKEKTLMFDTIKHTFDAFKDKLIHIVVDDVPHIIPSIDISKGEQWINEKHQRNSIQRGLKRLNLEPSDIIIISDVDEIPDPETLAMVKRNEIAIDFYCLEFDIYHYNLNTRFSTKWYHTKILSYGKFLSLGISCDDIRLYHFHNYMSALQRGGWHLSYFGTPDFIKNKIETFAHQECNTDVIKNNISNSISSFKCFYSSDYSVEKIPIKDNKYLPIKCETHLSKFIIL
jgi:beta-1,4-mannosyl-glycoprotein beta-1,4-N-acetylglucosaminyltransferase